MRPITLDDVARLPRPGTAIPGSFAFSPDGTVVTFLRADEGSMRRTLWRMDPATGESSVLFDPGAGVTDENVSHEEAMRRERQRMMHTGVTSYAWAKRAPVILVPIGEELWLIEDGAARRIGERALDPKISPDGAAVAFVRDGELWVLDIATGDERRLTFDASDGVTNGVAEYVAQEEMERLAGHWWSDEGSMIAYEQVDERGVPYYAIPHWGGDEATVEHHRYPFAGRENVRWRLGIVDARGGDTRWLEVPDDAEYLARAAWHPDGRLLAQTLTRDQQRLDLLAFEPATGEGTTLLTETSDVWVNLHDDLRFLSDGSFVWSSERTGTRQLYLYDARGSLVRQVTDLDGPVDAVLAVDADGRRVAFSAAVPSPLEAQIFVCDLDGGAPVQLTKDGGMHGAAFSPDLSVWAHVAHSAAQPPSVIVHARADHVVHEPPSIELALRAPEFFSFEVGDGTALHGMAYLPDVLPAPCVVRVYGGPHAQMVSDSWGVGSDLVAQYLAQEGFVVLTVDNRGSARRGLAFEAPLRLRMGSIEVEDQVAGVAYARARGWIDGDRVGVSGWSYGGYMTLMSMLKAPEVFRVGVAGAPVTAWDGYDTCYTERYMSTPQLNPDGYRDSSAMTHAARLTGRLLIVHGLIDENVHARHTMRFVEALAKANRHADLLLYPSERHSPRSEADRRNMHERIVAYFKEHL